MRRLPLALASLVVSMALAACSSHVTPTNPYDPATPPDQQRKAQLRGTLYVAGEDTAAVDVTVFLRQAGKIVRQTTTASDGAFLIDSLVPGDYTVEVSPTGFVPLTIAITAGPGEDLDIGRVGLTAAAAASVLEGTATLIGEADHGGTLVEAVGRAYTAVTSSTGAYRMELAEGTYTLRFSHKSFVTVSVADVTVARGETRDLDPVALPGNPASVSGHVDGELAAGGTGPLADATVTLDGTAVTGLTNAAGDFTLTGVPAGSYLLRVVRTGYGSASTPVLDLTGGETRDLPDPFTLSLSRGGLAGTVTLADSTDASGTVVEVAGTARATVTGSDGTYAFDDLLAGTYALSAHHDGYGRRDLGTWTVVAGDVTPVTAQSLTRQGGTVTVVEGPYVNVRGVHLLATASGVGWYKASESSTFADAPTWTAIPASAQVPFQLADADGEHVVYVVFSVDGVTPGTPTQVTVVLDRQAPSSPGIAVGDGTGFSSAPGGIVTLTLSAQDLPPTAGAAVSGVATMQLANDAAFATAQTRDYALTTTWTLATPGADGAKTVWVRFLDRAGNPSAAASTTVILDRLAPSSTSLALAGPPPAPAGTTTSTLVTATLGAFDANGGAGNGALLVRLSNTPGFEGARYQPFASSLAWMLLPADGSKTVWAEFMDPAGNQSSPIPASIVLDTVGPSSPTVAIQDRDTRPTNGYTRFLTVDLLLSAGGNPTAAQVSEDPSFTTAQVVTMGSPPPVSSSLTLGGSGTRTVWARFQDAAGNWSGTAAASITVDLVAPSAVAPALVPAGTTTVAAVQLVPPSAGQDEVQLSGSLTSPPAGTWTAAPAGVPIAVALTPGDGTKSIVATWRDLADNTTVAPAVTIALDGTAPTAASAFTVTGTLGDGTSSSTFTATTGVALDLHAVVSDGAAGTGVAQMEVSTDPTFANVSWVPFVASSAVPFTLPPGDGAKAVYARFRDPAGNVSGSASGSIQLAATPPSGGTVVIAGGAAATSSPSPTLAISATGAAQMLVSVDGVGSTWVGYSTAATASLADPEGNKVVAVKFRNAARVEGGSASAVIAYDHTAPPAPGLVVRGTMGNGASSNTSAASGTVAVTLSGVGDAVELSLWEDSSATAVPACVPPGSPTWVPLSTSATFVLSAADGQKRVCALLRDRAGNVGAAGSGLITLDTHAPSNPTFASLASTTTAATSIAGTLVAASTDPAPGTTVTYQCYASPASSAWTDCTGTGSPPSFTFALAPNTSNVIGVRARDGAFNASAGTVVSVVQDSIAPFPPNITAVRTTRDSLTLTWDPSADTDVDHFLVYYGNAAGDLAGAGAAQGASPVQAASAGSSLQTLTLTGLVSGIPYYVAVEAVDRAGNRSGRSGQRMAVPARVNPRLLATIGGQPRALSVLTDAASGKVFAYLGENQALVQLDVSSDAAVPLLVGRASVPNVVPDAPPAVIPCSRGAVAGHCVIVAGSTLEGDYRGALEVYRAPAPVVFFPLSGTTAAPALGSIETVLPAQPHRVLSGTVGGRAVVFTVEHDRVAAFDLSRLSFPRQLAAAPLSSAAASVLGATLVGSDLYAYTGWDSGGYVAAYPPVLQRVDVSGTLLGTLVVSEFDSPMDQDGNYLGDAYAGAPDPYPAFFGGLYIAYKDATDQAWMCSYSPPDPSPQACATLFDDPDVELVGTAGAGGHLYAFATQGLASTPFAYQVTVSGLSVTTGGTVSPSPSAEQALGGAAATYTTTSPAATAEHLLAIAHDQAGDDTLQRWTVSGTTATLLDPSYAYREVKPDWFAEADGLLFASQGPIINTVDVSDPLAPLLSRTPLVRANNTYGKLVVHGRYLYAATTNYTDGHGVDVFRINGDGTLTHQGASTVTVPTGSIPADLAVSGHWLFVARPEAASLAAWNVASPAAPVAAGTFSPGSMVQALAVRPATSGVTAYASVVYASLAGATPTPERFQTFSHDGASTFTALSSALTLPGQYAGSTVSLSGPYAVVTDLDGATLVYVGSPASPFVSQAALPVSGPAMLQGGYLVGLAPGSIPGGPVFDAYSTGAGGATIDGAPLYSGCAVGSATGSLVHRSGVYLASCDRNGIALFSVADPGGGRLLKRFDVSGTWLSGSAALAHDGYASFLGGALYQSSDPTRLYGVNEQANAAGTASGPSWITTAAAPASNPFARWMLASGGLTWSLQESYLGTGEALVGYEAANPLSTWPVRASLPLAGSDHVTAQPVTDGEYLYLPRTTGAGDGSSSKVEVYDLRTAASPSLLTFRSTSLTTGIAALALGRDRLYVGLNGGTSVAVLDTTSPSSLGAFTSVAIEPTAAKVTGIAVSGRWLFYTYQAQQAGLWGLGVVRLGATNRDGSGALRLGTLTSTLPLANPIVSGDTLYASNNLGVASFDLTPLWQTAGATTPSMPAPLGGTVNADALRSDPVRFLVEGPFGYLVGGTYRAFDLR